jgi:hypothetical protein
MVNGFQGGSKAFMGYIDPIVANSEEGVEGFHVGTFLGGEKGTGKGIILTGPAHDFGAIVIIFGSGNSEVRDRIVLFPLREVYPGKFNDLRFPSCPTIYIGVKSLSYSHSASILSATSFADI